MGKLMALCVLLALAGLGLLVYVGLDAPVSRVRVSGELDDAERLQVRETIRQTLAGGLLSADLETLRGAIMALHWPRSVTVRRVWPATLEVAVEKPTVVARWRDAFLASDGRVVRLPGPRGALPTFDCAGSPPRLAMEIFQRLSTASSAESLAISVLTEDELGEWSVTFDSDLTVVLGADELGERLGRFLTVYRAHLKPMQDDIARVDARYDNGVAVSWRNPAPDAALLAAAGVGVNRTLVDATNGR